MLGALTDHKAEVPLAKVIESVVRVEDLYRWRVCRYSLCLLWPSIDRRCLRDLIQLRLVLQPVRRHLIIKLIHRVAYRLHHRDLLRKVYIQRKGLLLRSQIQRHLHREMVLRCVLFLLRILATLQLLLLSHIPLILRMRTIHPQ